MATMHYEEVETVDCENQACNDKITRFKRMCAHMQDVHGQLVLRIETHLEVCHKTHDFTTLSMES